MNMEDKAVVYTYLRGALGNQMFIYAAARAALKRYFDDDGVVLLSGERLFEGIPAELKPEWYFGLLKNYKLSPKTELVREFHLPLHHRLVKKICGYRFCKTHQDVYRKAKRTASFAQKFGVIACENGYIDMAPRMPRRIYMDSFFQSERFFPGMNSVLAQEFSLVTQPGKEAAEMASVMRSTESVALAVRLGDYVNNPLHQICTPAYYQQAIDRICAYKPGCRIFLFSDDLPLARQLLKLPADTVAEAPCATPNESLWLMSQCRHFIISNSSFHWWAQYLSQSPEKIVLAPNRWFAQDVPCALFQSDWELIET